MIIRQLCFLLSLLLSRSPELERPTISLQEDDKLKEMIYSIYNYVSAQKEREGEAGGAR